MHEPTVLVVEDDPELLQLLVRGLREEGFRPVAATSGHHALERAPANPPDALVIDIGLPDADGRDLCQALRAQGISGPVLFLTARDAVADRLAGFAAGGDDYVTKPFAFAEVVARLRAWLRRADVDDQFELGELRLDPTSHTVVRGHESVKLTPTEFRLLAALAARPGTPVRRAELVAAAWPAGSIVHDNTLDVYVARLRRKLRRLGTGHTIQTAHRIGYALD